MDLRLHLDNLRPPSGWLEVADRRHGTSGSVLKHERLAFGGWLGLLQALSSAVGETPEESGAFAARGEVGDEGL